nr:LacI family DNA-binding transcriptional regulator [Clostridia bacterium]
DRPGVSDITRNNIKKIIRQTNYTPNLNSRKLILNKSFNIFVVVDNTFAAFDNMFYNSAIMGIIERCKAVNYNVVLSDITIDYQNSGLKRAIDENNVDGVIFLQNTRPEISDSLRSSGLPFVLLDSHGYSQSDHSVYCDYSDAAYRAVEYLIKCGHERIAFIGDSNIQEFYLASFDGYMKSLSDHGLSSNVEWVTSATQNNDSASEAVRRLMRSDIRPDAVFCAADLIAIYAMKALHHMGIRVPDDISVCAVDNIISAQFCTPALTTVDIAKKHMGIAAVDILMELMSEPDSGKIKNRMIAAGNVIERESVLNKNK